MNISQVINDIKAACEYKSSLLFVPKYGQNPWVMDWAKNLYLNRHEDNIWRQEIYGEWKIGNDFYQKHYIKHPKFDYNFRKEFSPLFYLTNNT